MTKDWPKPWSLDKFEALAPDQRYNLWVNARQQTSPAAAQLVAAIEGSGLPYWASGGTAHDHPFAIQMEAVINSPEGRAACLEATGRGDPALGGVEPLIVETMGERYGPQDQLTVLAGYQVGTLMHALGYEEVGKGKMPPGSVAKTAAVWKLRKA